MADDTPPDLPSNRAAVAPKDAVASLAGQLRHASTGTLARLRRFHPLQNPQAAMFETERLLQAAQVAAHEPEDRARWALVLHCLALAQGAHDVRADAEPGAVLARLRFSEARLRQLVEADEAVLTALVPRLARRLAAAAAAINWWPLVNLLLHAGSEDAQRMKLADGARQRLIHHYLLAQSRSMAESSSTES